MLSLINLTSTDKNYDWLCAMFSTLGEKEYSRINTDKLNDAIKQIMNAKFSSKFKEMMTLPGIFTSPRIEEIIIRSTNTSFSILLIYLYVYNNKNFEIILDIPSEYIPYLKELYNFDTKIDIINAIVDGSIIYKYGDLLDKLTDDNVNDSPCQYGYLAEIFKISCEKQKQNNPFHSSQRSLSDQPMAWADSSDRFYDLQNLI